MNDTRFDALVRRLEQESQASPRRYRLRVALLGLLGYAYIGMVLAVLLAAIAGCIWLMAVVRSGNGAVGKVIIALLVLVWTVGRALWVRVEPPVGRRLTREDAPALFAEAEEIRRRVQAPRAHVILLTDDYNASVSQVPRLGVFGWPRNYLVVGLPLLAALPPGHVRAVLAHEFAHLSRAHGRFGVWIYRVRASWYQLMGHFDANPSWFAAVFRRFFDWYTPYFGAYTFVLQRQHEYEADRLAAGVVGEDAMAQTLVDLEVRDSWLQKRFWPQVWKESETSDAPPADVHARLEAAARQPLPPVDLEAWTTAAFKRRTDTIDTHPAIRDRVAALRRHGARPVAEAAFAKSAAAHYLGASHDRLVAELSAEWQLHAGISWSMQRAAREEAREGLAALEAKAATEPLDLEERWQLADWTEDVHGPDAAMPHFDALLAEEPEHASALFAKGRVLLARGDEQGLALIERVMAKDVDAVLPGCTMAYHFLAAEGRLEEADRYRARASSRATLLREAEREREQITTKDRYLASELPAEQVAALVAQLDRQPKAGRAWLARKVVQHYADEAPLHVLVIVARNRWYWSDHAKQLKQAEEIATQLELPPGVNAFALGPQSGELLRPVAKVKGSLIYDARKRRAERAAAQAAAATPAEAVAEPEAQPA